MKVIFSLVFTALFATSFPCLPLPYQQVLSQVYAVEMHTIADQKRLTDPSYHDRWEASVERAGGGHLIWLGIHFLDMASFITGGR